MTDPTRPEGEEDDEVQAIDDLEVEGADADEVQGGYRGRYSLKLGEAQGTLQPPPSSP